MSGEDIIQIYDPGPDEARVKEISVLKMYDAMRKKGGLYIIDKSKGENEKKSSV